MAAESTVEDTIAQAWQLANESASAAQSYADYAMSAAGGFIIPGTPTSISKPDLPDSPTLQIPSNIAQFFDNNFDAYDLQLRTRLTEGLSEFLADYFPDYDDTLKELHDWSIARLNGLPSEYAPAFFEILFNSTAARIQQEADANKAATYDTWAARGFSLPQGPMLAALDMYDDKALAEKQHALAQLKMKQADLNWEAMKLAVEQLWQIRKHYIDAILDYMKQILLIADSSRKTVADLVAAIASLQQATVALYNGNINAEELMLRYYVAKNSSDLQQDQVAINAFSSSTEKMVNAALAAAEAMGKMAAAAVGSQNTMATIAHNTIAEEAQQ